MSFSTFTFCLFLLVFIEILFSHSLSRFGKYQVELYLFIKISENHAQTSSVFTQIKILFPEGLPHMKYFQTSLLFLFEISLVSCSKKEKVYFLFLACLFSHYIIYFILFSIFSFFFHPPYPFCILYFLPAFLSFLNALLPFPSWEVKNENKWYKKCFKSNY